MKHTIRQHDDGWMVMQGEQRVALVYGVENKPKAVTIAAVLNGTVVWDMRGNPSSIML